MKKNKVIMTAAATLMAAMLSAMPAAAEDTVTSILTGKQVSASIGRKRPIALMFNNIEAAVPQYGISHADVKVEAEVEGLITRIMGVLEDYENISRIGSVRSARNYYYYFAREFNAIYCHFGEAAYCTPLLKLNSTIELDGESEYGDIVYYRSDDRVSPHNAFTDYSHIQAGIDHVGIDRNLPDGYNEHFKFAADGESVNLENGIVANVVMPGYVYNHARFDYNAADGLYYRSQYHDVQVDGDTGEQLTTKNIILQYCDSAPFDDNGYLWTDDVSGGTGKYITNGRAIDITWKKEVPENGSEFIVNIDTPNLSVPVHTGDFYTTHYYDMDGNEITMNQGQTWICLVRNNAAERVVITDNTGISTDVIDTLG